MSVELPRFDKFEKSQPNIALSKWKITLMKRNSQWADKLSLRKCSLHIWCTFLDEVNEHWASTNYYQFLHAGDIERMRSYVFQSDRLRLLVSRALCRTALSHYAPLAPSEWAFKNNAHGKPYISNIPLEDFPFPQFNISHSGNVVVIVIAWSAIGVDVELLRSIDNLSDVSQSVMSKTECFDLSISPADLRSQQFLELWTLKEAYSKAHGLGLELPFRDIEFSLSDNNISLTYAPLKSPEPSETFFQYLIAENYVLSLCVIGEKPCPVNISFIKSIPTLHTRKLVAHLLRKSI